MRRYAGQELGAGARIAVLSNDAIGNFVVVTPLLQMLRRQRAPRSLDYFCGTRVSEMLEASDLFDAWTPIHGPSVRELFASLPSVPYDLVVNVEQTPVSKVVAAWLAGDEGLVCGPCAGEEGRGELAFGDDRRGRLWLDRHWVAADLVETYPFLRSGWIGEIFCRLAFLEGDIPPYAAPIHEPKCAIPDVLIACSASSEEKLWSEEAWYEVVRCLRGQGLQLGLLGASRRDQGRYWTGARLENRLVADLGVVDLRGAFPLPRVAGALRRARAVLTLDNGIMHLAVAACAPVVALFRHGIHRLWAPPSPRLWVLTPGEDQPVAAIEASAALAAMREALVCQVS